MAAVSAGFQVIGGLVGAMGQMQAAEAEAQAHEYNAQVADRNRAVIEDQTKRAMEDQRFENMRVFRNMRAEYGHANIDLNGSALDVFHDTFVEQKLAKRRIKYEGTLKAIEQIDAKNLELMGASSARAAGSISAISSILGGLGGAVSTMAGSSGGFSFGGGSTAASGSVSGAPTISSGVPTPQPRPVYAPTPRPRPIYSTIPAGAGGH